MYIYIEGNYITVRYMVITHMSYIIIIIIIIKYVVKTYAFVY
jgi:hypothetical protein